jgi:hypothetical protein
MHPTETLQRCQAAQGEGEHGSDAQARPQLRGLGHSAMAKRYGIADLVEARAYLSCSRTPRNLPRSQLHQSALKVL